MPDHTIYVGDKIASGTFTEPKIGDKMPDGTYYAGLSAAKTASRYTKTSSGLGLPIRAGKVGDKMEDGTIFAGVSPDTGKPMFILPDDGYPAFTRFMSDHPRISRFLDQHPKLYRFALRTARHIPILKNHVPLFPPFLSFNEALKYTKELNAHGHRDWRVPTAAELNVFFNNRSAIGEFNEAAFKNPPTGIGPQRTKLWANGVWVQRFNDGLKTIDPTDKVGVVSVRPIRHDPP